MRTKRILILGGTRDARELAAGLIAKGFDVVTSLAGVTENPVLPPGTVRRGGFGGVAGLTSYLGALRIAVVIDATHPFAAQMSAQAHEACRQSGVPLMRLERPEWQATDEDRWTIVHSAAEAAAALPAGARALVTIGRKEIGPFFARSDVSGVARMIEETPAPATAGWRVLRERPPFTLEAERRLVLDEAISHLVTKNAGGTVTDAKLTAARQLRIPVIMIARPAKPATPSFTTPGALIDMLLGMHSP